MLDVVTHNTVHIIWMPHKCLVSHEQQLMKRMWHKSWPLNLLSITCTLKNTRWLP